MYNGHIIISQPDPDLANVMRQHLESLNFHVLVERAPHAAEAWSDHVTAKLVLLDVDAPPKNEAFTRFDAYEVCARIRRKPSYDRVPIVLLSGLEHPRRRAAAKRAGATAFILKPLSVADLTELVDRMVGLPARPRPTGVRSVPVPGFADKPHRSWGEPAQSLAWPFGKDSSLSTGADALAVLRRVRPLMR